MAFGTNAQISQGSFTMDPRLPLSQKTCWCLAYSGSEIGLEASSLGLTWDPDSSL